MKDNKIAAVFRAGAFSPNHIGNDAAILNAVIEHLRKRGCVVNEYNERQFIDSDIDEDVIIDMCREPESLAKLERLEDAGKLVINSGYGIRNCTRERMTRLLMGNGIPYPDSIIVDTNVSIIDDLKEKDIERCWIKRGEFHAQHKEDVTYCRHATEAQETLHEFFYRGIQRAVINRHLDGDLVKFYGLADGSFFYWFYPLLAHHSKFGDEEINGAVRLIQFDEKKLRAACEKAAEVTGIMIYGGDCIVDSNGDFSIIDFNDWPSFAPCRAEAAPLIARSILNAVRARFGVIGRERTRGERRQKQ